MDMVQHDERCPHQCSKHELGVQLVEHKEKLSQYAQETDDTCKAAENLLENVNSCNVLPATINITLPTSQRLHDNKVAISKGGGLIIT